MSGLRTDIRGNGGDASLSLAYSVAGNCADHSGGVAGNPLQIRRNAAQLAKLIAVERIDIVHAQSAAAAWSAVQAAHKQPVFLVTSFPDRLPANRWPGTLYSGSLTRGHRVIAPSSYVAAAMIERYRIKPARITVIPRAVDTALFNPAAISARDHDPKRAVTVDADGQVRPSAMLRPSA